MVAVNVNSWKVLGQRSSLHEDEIEFQPSSSKVPENDWKTEFTEAFQKVFIANWEKDAWINPYLSPKIMSEITLKHWNPINWYNGLISSRTTLSIPFKANSRKFKEKKCFSELNLSYCKINSIFILEKYLYCKKGMLFLLLLHNRALKFFLFHSHSLGGKAKKLSDR